MSQREFNEDSSPSQDQHQIAESSQQDMEELDEEQIVMTIIQLGNSILQNMGVEEPIEDVSVFFSDAFYIQFFQSAFPDFDFSEFEETQDEEQMAANIQTLIDLLSEKILMYDLSHIRGDEIVSGNPEHCINLLQLAKEISSMMSGDSQAENNLQQDLSGSGLASASPNRQQQLQGLDGQPDDNENESENEGEELGRMGQLRRHEDQLQDLEQEDSQDQPVSSQRNDVYGKELDFEGEQDNSEGVQQIDDLGEQFDDEEPVNPDEVSINLEEAIATAEQINQRSGQSSQENGLTEAELLAAAADDGEYEQQMLRDGVGGSDSQAQEREQEHMDENDEQQLADEIAGLVTDGHHQPDNLDDMRLQQQREIEEDQMQYGDEDQQYGQEVDGEVMEQMVDEHGNLIENYGDELEQDENQVMGGVETGVLNEQQQDEQDEARSEEDGELEDRMAMLHPDLIAAAHQMGIDMDSEQISELQRFIAQQNIDLNNAAAEAEDDQGYGQEGEDEGEGQLSEDQATSQPQSRHLSHDKRQQSSQRKGQSESQRSERFVSNRSNGAALPPNNDQFEQEGQEGESQEDHEDENGEQQEGDIDQNEDDSEEQLQLDLDELNEEDKEMLVAYLQEEYEKNPDTFQFQKEKIQELINEQFRRGRQAADANQDGDNQSDHQNEDQFEDQQEEEYDQMQGEGQEEGEEGQEQADEADLDIEGGGQQIEEDELPSEQEMIDQQYSQEQIEEVLRLKQAQNDQNQANQEAIAMFAAQQQQQQMQQLHQLEGIQEEPVGQQLATDYRPRQKKKKSKQTAFVQNNARLPPRSTLTAKTRKSEQDRVVKQYGRMMKSQPEGLDAHALQRLMQAPIGSKPQRPQTAKRSQATMQNNTAKPIRPSTAKPRQPAQSYKQFIAAQSSRTSRQQKGVSSAATHLKDTRKGSSRKRNGVKRQQLNTISHPLDHEQNAAQFMALDFDPATLDQLTPEQQEQLLAMQQQQMMDQQQYQQQMGEQGEEQENYEGQEEGQNAPDMPVFNEEFLNQLSEEQLQQVIQHQQALIQQQNAGQRAQSLAKGNKGARRSSRNKGGPQLPPKPEKRRSRSGIRGSASATNFPTESTGRQNRLKAAHIYSTGSTTGLGQKRRTSKQSSRGGTLALSDRGSGSRKPKNSKQKRRKVQPGQGILLNNFFPALEANVAHSGEKPSVSQLEANQMDQQQDEGQLAAMLMAQQLNQAPGQNDEGVINEVPPEEEEGESQDIVNSRAQQSNSFNQQQNLNGQLQPVQGGLHLDQITAILAEMGELDEEQQQALLSELTPDQQQQLLIASQAQAQGIPLDENGLPVINMQNPEDLQAQQQMNQENNQAGEVKLTDEQLVELLQNADQLSAEQRQQLQLILKDRYKHEIKSQKKNQYNNIYNILTENVAKAKLRLAKLAESPGKLATAQQDRETMERIMRQIKEYENLKKLHNHEVKNKSKGKQSQQQKQLRQMAREIKMKEIKEKQFEQELINQQKSLMYKRNAQQVRLCQKVYKLASELEKNKLLEEKKAFQENQNQKRKQKQVLIDGIESFYKDKISMLKERIETEKFERKIAQAAQKEALSRMKKELNQNKRKEIEKVFNQLKQEDAKYDLQSSNLNKLENQIISLYKK